jgi:dTDP-4-amino-4,6-dideoxygalactose transaminase
MGNAGFFSSLLIVGSIFVLITKEHRLRNSLLLCLKVRTDFIDFLKKRSIVSAFHYVPLHSSIAGKKYGIFHDEDVNTTVHSEKLARLPMWYGMTEKEVDSVIEAVNEFFE